MRSRAVIARRLALPAVAALLLSACPENPPTPVPGPSFPAPTAKAGPQVTITFVGTLGDPSDEQYLDAARLAAAQVNASADPIRLTLRVLDDRGDEARGRESVMAAATSSAAVVYAGPGSVLRDLRTRLEPTHVPVVLLAGDLYTTRDQYANVFQASVPELWQARVLAHYLHVRGSGPVTALVGTPIAKFAWDSASAEEHLQAAPADPALPPGYPAVVLDDPESYAQVLQAKPGQALAADFALLGQPGDEGAPPPGTVAVGQYAWSGWADPLPRVHRFREDFRAMFGRLPLGLQQEGYDAVRLLAVALADTGGRGGQTLIDRLETVKDRWISSMPIRLGPDDHVFYDDWSLGVFAVAGPGERVETWMDGLTPWRPVMRSFSADVKRTTVWERDRGPFFPNWHEPEPSPVYKWSKLGIVTPPSDPLH